MKHTSFAFQINVKPQLIEIMPEISISVSHSYFKFHFTL